MPFQIFESSVLGDQINIPAKIDLRKRKISPHIIHCKRIKKKFVDRKLINYKILTGEQYLYIIVRYIFVFWFMGFLLIHGNAAGKTHNNPASCASFLFYFLLGLAEIPRTVGCPRSDRSQGFGRRDFKNEAQPMNKNISWFEVFFSVRV